MVDFRYDTDNLNPMTPQNPLLDIRTLLFDIDGTLLDTREFILQATEYTLAQFGIAIPPRTTLTKMVGKPFPEFYQILSGQTDVSDLITTHRNFQLEHLNLSVPFAGTIETLTTLKSRGYRCATVSTRAKITTLETLELAHIKDFFEVCISGDDAPAHKPDPAPLFLALQQLSTDPAQAVMIGDSHLDVQAGKNAGTKTIRVSYGFHTDYIDDPKPDSVIHNINELLTLFP